MRKQLMTAFLYTIVTTLLLGIAYPLGITLLAHLLMRNQADGQLILRNGVVVGSRMIGQVFTGPDYFNSRPSAAGTGYDAANSSGSNLGPTNAALIARVEQSVQSFQSIASWRGSADRSGHRFWLWARSRYNPRGSGVPGYSRSEGEMSHGRRSGISRAGPYRWRQFGILGEPRVNVLELNLALDEKTRSLAKCK